MAWLENDRVHITALEVVGSRQYNITHKTGANIIVTVVIPNEISIPDLINTLKKEWFTYGDYNLTDIKIKTQNVKGVSTSDDGEEAIYNIDLVAELTYSLLPGKKIDVEETYINTSWMYIEEEISPNYIAMALSPDGLVWGKKEGTGQSLNRAIAPGEEPSFTLNRCTYTRTVQGYKWFQQSWLGLLNSTHNADFTTTIDGIVFPADTLLLTNLTIKRPTNNMPIIIIATYEYQEKGWNLFYHRGLQTDEAGWYDIRYAADDTVVEIYPSKDHSAFLF